MREEDAGTKAEKPERSLRAGGGTAEGRETERQAGTARDDYAGEGALAPEPHVLPVNRRIGNGTSGGVGGQGLRGPTLPAEAMTAQEPYRHDCGCQPSMVS